MERRNQIIRKFDLKEEDNSAKHTPKLVHFWKELFEIVIVGNGTSATFINEVKDIKSYLPLLEGMI